MPTGDAVQFMVSTTGKALHGKNQGHGWRTRQVGGLLNTDETVIQLSRDMTNTNFQISGASDDSLQNKTEPRSEDAAESEPGPEIWGRHGKGNVLISRSIPDMASSSPASSPKRHDDPAKH